MVAVLAGRVFASVACLGSEVICFFPEHLMLLGDKAKVAPVRALCLASLAVTVPAGPLARVGAAFAVCCDLFVFWFHRVFLLRALFPARGASRELTRLTAS